MLLEYVVPEPRFHRGAAHPDLPRGIGHRMQSAQQINPRGRLVRKTNPKGRDHSIAHTQLIAALKTHRVILMNKHAVA